MKKDITNIKLNNIIIKTVTAILQKYCPLFIKQANADSKCNCTINHTHCSFMNNITIAVIKLLPLQTKLWIKCAHKKECLTINDIIRVKGSGHYTKFYLRKNIIKTYCGSLAFYEQELALSNIFRIHRSHLVNKKYINKDSYSKFTILMSDNFRISVSKPFRDHLQSIFNTA